MGRRLLASHAAAVLIGAGGWWLWESLQDLDGGLAGLIALWLALSLWFVVSHWTERSLSLPLARLRDEVERMGEGHAPLQDPLTTPDEIGELADTIRSTGQRLEKFVAGLWEKNRELERQVSERTTEVEERSRALESVIDAIVHDLRATVVSMQSVAGNLLERSEEIPAGNGNQALRRLLTMTEHQERLLGDLLTIVRLGNEPLRIKEVDVEALLIEVIEECRTEAGATGVTFRLPEGFPVVSADPTRLRAVFTHLMQNAIKFMGEQRDPEIEISAHEESGWVHFSIRDNGIGIDPAYHGKIFGLFQRLGEIEADGTGVGLAIVKQIVEQSGGRVWVDSKKGEGTTVSFTLPTPDGSAPHRESGVRG